MISAIIFDCDGVLVDSEVLAHEVETKILGDIGLSYDRKEFTARFMGMSDAAFWDALEQDAHDRLGRSIRDELREPMRRLMREAVQTRLTEVPGALAALSVVQQPKAVASSSTREHLEIKLKLVGHWDHFAPHVYSAEHVTHAKPAPDLFLHAAQALGVAPEACLVLEDSINGVTAARAAGMRVWGFMGGGHMTDEIGERLLAAGAERLISNWDEAARLFAELQA
jgi:HAD superfamily hydrolase (TIGR01509 family)